MILFCTILRWELLISALFHPTSLLVSYPRRYYFGKLLKFQITAFFHCCFARCAERVVVNSCVAKHYGCKRARHRGLIANGRSQANPDNSCVRNMNGCFARFAHCATIIPILSIWSTACGTTTSFSTMWLRAARWTRFHTTAICQPTYSRNPNSKVEQLCAWTYVTA